METIQIIFDHLDLKNLKPISQTCRKMDRISWQNRSDASKIIIKGNIPEKNMAALRKTQKAFKNITFNSFNSYFYPSSIRQLQTLRSIQFINLEICENVFDIISRMPEVEQFKNDIMTITIHILKTPEPVIRLKVREFHLTARIIVINRAPQDNAFRKRSIYKPFKCEICSRAYNTHHKLRTHMKSHPVGPCNCPLKNCGNNLYQNL